MSKSADSVVGFHHPGIVVPNLERAIEFYSQLLGYELVSKSCWTSDDKGFNQVVGLEGSAASFCMLRGTNAYLEIFKYSSPAKDQLVDARYANELGIRHLSFQVENIEILLDRCAELGGSRINDPFVVPGRAAAAYCRDPFGNLLEFIKPMGSFPELITT